MAGWSYTDSGSATQHAVIWKNGTIVDLGALPGAGTQSQGFAINGGGQVAGLGRLAAGDVRALTWKDGGVFDSAAWADTRSG